MRQKHLFFFILLGIFAVFVIFALVFLFFSAGSPGNVFKRQTDKLSNQDPLPAPATTTESLWQSYLQKLRDLSSRVDEVETIDEDFISEIRRGFLNVRVPKEMQQKHLSSLLSILETGSNTTNLSSEAARSAIKARIEDLIIEAQSL